MMVKNKLYLSVNITVILLIAFCCFVMPMSVQAADGSCTVGVLDENGGMTDTQAYDEPEQAWNAACTLARSGKNACMVLGKNWEHDSFYEAVSGGSVTVDLNGYAIIRNRNGKQTKNGYIFHIGKGARLIINDSDPDSEGYDGISGGVITGGANTNGAGAIQVEAGGELTINAGTIYKCTTSEHGGAILLNGDSKAKAKLSMNGGRIYFCQTVDAWTNCHGGAVYADRGEVLINNSKIDSCYSEDNGGAVYLNDGDFTIKNSLIIGNHCGDHGGGIYVGGGRMNVINTRFSSNEAKNGGGLYVDYSSQNDYTKIRKCIFYKNKANNDGGGIYVNDDRCHLLDTDITYNTAGGSGGGVYVDSRYDLNIKGLMRVYSNQGKNDQDNITLQSGTVTTAYLYSGGLYEGSRVGIGSTGKNVKLGEGISTYQLERYYFADSGSLSSGDTSRQETPFYASAFGDGSLLVIGISSVIILVSVIAMVVVRLRKRKEESGE